jgi:hypothetical protein
VQITQRRYVGIIAARRRAGRCVTQFLDLAGSLVKERAFIAVK